MGCNWNLAKTQFGIVLKDFRPRKEGREFRLILSQQKGRGEKIKVKQEESKVRE